LGPLGVGLSLGPRGRGEPGHGVNAEDGWTPRGHGSDPAPAEIPNPWA
jgi:hypothetical protein